ncbi:hypothetical protein MKX01_023751 [Papaver californicum]|nr:hypothetical protein MKX01_023751 [Papaver californicum]
MQRKMTSTGMKRLIKRRGQISYPSQEFREESISGQQATHIKNSENNVLARNNLDRRLKSQNLARKLNSILLKKISGHWHKCYSDC